nr:hypothetical protein [Bacillus sp. REN3]
MSSRVENEENRISSLRSQVDGRIASRRNIGRNLSEAAAKARAIDKKLGKLNQFVDASMDLYVKADKKADRFREPDKKSIWEKIADGFKTANDIRKGFRKGVAEALFSTVEGIWNAVTHPIKTANGMIYAIGHPVETAKSIWKSISDSWKNDVINGDAKSRSEWFGRAVGEAALAIVGTKGVDKAVKVAKGARVVKEDGGARVVRPETIEKKDGVGRDGKSVTPETRNSGVGVGTKKVPQRIDSKEVKGDNGSKGIVKTRPSWRQSEIDVEKDFPDYNAQKSFKDGKEVPYGEKGSSRPDLYRTGHSIEVKNYIITTPSGRSRLVNNVSKQVEKRLSDLPNGTKQSVIIDIRGQSVSDEIVEELYEKIVNKTNGKVDIRFKTN